MQPHTNPFKQYTFSSHEHVSCNKVSIKEIMGFIAPFPRNTYQFSYIHLFQDEQCIVTDKSCDIWSYRDDVFDVKNLMAHIHPDDFLESYNLTKKAFQKIFTCSTQIYHFKYYISYRIKNKNNQYKRILRETTPLLVDKTGKLICTMSRCTDITHLGHSNEIKAWINFPGKISDLSNEFNNILSNREKEILLYLSNGYSSKKISHLLFISKLTVDKHRANMLKKTRTNNTSELVRFAIERGIIGS